MRFLKFANYHSLSKYACQIILQAIAIKPSSLWCAAAGRSPKGAYELLGQYQKTNPGYFEKLQIIQLDEWIGLPQIHPSSCAHFILEHLARPLKITTDNLFLFDGLSSDLSRECLRADHFLSKRGPIDLCVLGIGENGHLGFNEPGQSFTTHTHVIHLQTKTQQHQMVETVTTKPSFGISLGISDILQSKQIVLIIAGKKKRVVLKQLQEDKISPGFPASALWKHTNVTCLLDREVL